MFTTNKRLRRRTTTKDLNRADYLQALVTEFQDSFDPDAKLQVLANLANFSYDPINFGYLRDLHVIDLFVDCIDFEEDVNGKLAQFAVGGLCNLAADAENRRLILDCSMAVQYAVRCLTSANEETLTSSITLLMQLIVPESRSRVLTQPVINCMERLAQSDSQRVKNLAVVFLEDYCGSGKFAQTQACPQTLLNIPLPPW